MARLAPITAKDQVPEKHHAIVDAIAQSRGAIQGPFTMFLHCPELAGRVAHLGGFVRFEGSLDMRARVLAAMTVAREFEAVYVWGAQTGGARRQGVPEPTITAIRENHSRGIPPEDAEIVDFTRRSKFREQFEAKGRLRPYLEAIPSIVIVHPAATFVGLQSLAESDPDVGP